MMILLHQIGFTKVGGVEYTNAVYNQLICNMRLLSLEYFENAVNLKEAGCYLYNDDAANMCTVLDMYNWFCLFNPFGMRKTIEVLNTIFSSLNRKPRQIHIFYAEPMGDYYIMKTGRFIREEYRINFYEGTYWTYVYTNIQ